MSETSPAAALAAMSEAVVGVAGDLSVHTVLERLVRAARRLVAARYAAIGIPDPEGDGFAQFIHVGMSDALVEMIGPLPRTHGLLGSMLKDPRPFRTADVRADPRFRWWPAAHPRMGSFLGVPIVFKGDIVGAFYLADKECDASFSDDDEALIAVLGAHAAIAVENARLYEQSRELSIVEERNRIARELHDTVTQTVFSLALTAGAATSRVRSDPAQAEADLRTVQQLAETAAGELRSLIFELRPPALAADGLVVTVGKHLDLVGRAHGLTVRLTAEGDLDLPVVAEAPLFRIVQEALNNVVRHASASNVEVVLAVAKGEAILTVTDDGGGFDPSVRGTGTRRLGLTSMRERAAALGGSATVTSAPGSGTTVRVALPLG